ncbi:DMT family transporter [Yoonia litorea]|uniref:Threonine/homoserine efflux transporter RhtA n=1 Tax=Yoonia litorea TaxID=1123755 RepID=A0A1I6M061_9RHOB|nr:DMT family transporter [Yoonia litorea]SFS09099.1 Threonine/homoserine efflux transporter RhtA [Yoonia litorea]
MDMSRAVLLSSLIVLVSGVFWGLYWMPVREIEDLGLRGAWGSVAAGLAGTLVLAPFGWKARRTLLAADRLALASTALGGFAFLLYSVSYVYGQVAVVVILFFLAPVWATLLGRWWMGWPITPMRVLVLICGLAGLAVMLGGEGNLPIPRAIGEWLGLLAGLCWAVASIGIRVRPPLPPVGGGFVFVGGAFLGGLCLAPLLSGPPDVADIAAPVSLMAVVFATGAFWWACLLIGIMWATPRLDPARTSILLMVEVPVAAVSAAVLIGEHLTTPQLIGGILVVAAGVLEVVPARRRS